MALILTSAPAAEPVTVSEAKAHLRVDGSVEDVLIASLILTSRLHVEAALGLALITQGWTLTLDTWPKKSRPVILPLRPVQAVTEISVLAEDGTPEVIAPADYLVDGKGVPPRIVPNGTAWPAPGRPIAGIEVAFTAGFGGQGPDVPEPIRHAVLMLTAHWYEHRDPIEIGSPQTEIPKAVSNLLRPYRLARL